jgi:hypothetical protein
MREDFTVTIPNSIYFPNLKNIITSVLLAVVLTYPILGINRNGIFASIILFILFFIIINSLTNENLSNELPSYLYPTPPRTGLDGISLTAHVAGDDNNINSTFGNY